MVVVERDSKKDFMNKSCEAFVQSLASKEPVPGGGGAAALVGAVGTALGGMVGSLTLGKPKYADVQDSIAVLKEKANRLQEELLALVRRDAEVFEPLSKAYGLPGTTEAERAEKARVMETALRDACSVPLEIMEKCGAAIEMHRELAEKGAAIAISDVGCGVICCKAALQAASLNVFINTKSMTNRACAESINEKANKLLNGYTALADQIYARVAARFE
jgi:formiminotetrahydrofolate cyclodeaminase